MSPRRRTALAVLATLAVLAPLAYLWQDSVAPDTYSIMDMGYLDGGGGPAAHHHDGPGRSVESLTGDVATGPADVDLTLVARAETFRLADGRDVDGYTFNGTSPGPTIEAVQGRLVQVRLVNESVPDGVSLHWHGVDVPNAADGVAGVTQDAVGVGAQHVYQFRVEQAGTYWYHSHQISHVQVQRGLLGALVVRPATGIVPATDVPATDVAALVHNYDGRQTVNGRAGVVPVAAAPGTRVRIRVINTDNGAMSVWVSGAPYRLVAVDGTDLLGPSEVTDAYTTVTAGGRHDLDLEMPPDGRGVRVELGSTALVLGTGAVTRSPQPRRVLDLLDYGTPATAPAQEGGPLNVTVTTPDPALLDPAAATRRFEYAIGRRPGFLDGIPGYWWTINGHLFPDVPMFVVAEGDVVRMRIRNSSGEAHPMHLHGHHLLVLSRDGVASTGSPWWVDSLHVGDGETYEVAFRADNPGLWVDHCHHLGHAVDGLIAHLMYEGVTTPFVVGGPAANSPE